MTSGPTPAGWGRTHRWTPWGPERAEELAADLVQPTLDELRRRGVDYRGVLYAGLMLTDDGPKVLEFNVRFGDPEAQVVLPRLDSDLAVLLHDVAAGGLRSAPRFRDDAAVTVVCATEGYPHAPRSGDVIEGLDAARAVDGVSIFCAGVAQGSRGELVTSGGGS